MKTRPGPRNCARGQILPIFAIMLPVIVLLVALVIDGGYALAQKRFAQNAADLSSLSAARVVAQFVAGGTATDHQVRVSIDQTAAANGALPITYGAPHGPRYVNMSGIVLGWVDGGSIPPGTAGVTVEASRTWHTFFAGIAGQPNWAASAVATARGGYRAGGPPAGNLLPIGVSKKTYDSSPLCPAGVPTGSCTVVDLTEGYLNIPGGFGWLKFGCDDHDKYGNPFGLGQNGAGCGNSKPFLNGEWGDLSANPPVWPSTYGCCSAIGLPGSGDDIGSLPGNKASVNNSDPGVAYYIDNGVIGWVPIWDWADGNGSNGYYHIVGYAGFQITDVKGSKNIEGILREVVIPGPVTTTSPGFAGAPLAVQLIR